MLMSLWSVQRPVSSSTASPCTPHPASCLANACHWSQGGPGKLGWDGAAQIHHLSKHITQVPVLHKTSQQWFLSAQSWARCDTEMFFNTIGVVFKGVFSVCAENKCRLAFSCMTWVFNGIMDGGVAGREKYRLGLRDGWPWRVRSGTPRRQCEAAGLQRGGRNNLWQLDKCTGSGSVCGCWHLPEPPWMVGDIKARHPGITPGRLSGCKPLPRCWPRRDRSSVSSRPLEMVSHSSCASYFWK